MIDVIFSQLLSNKNYFVRVWPYLKSEYFDVGAPRIVYNAIKKHVDEYNNIPSKVSLSVALDQQALSDVEFKESKSLINDLSTDIEDLEWAVTETERFAKNAAVYNATSKIIEIQTNAELPEEKRNKKLPGLDAIADIMKEAVQVSFDNSVGHDWIDDYEERWLKYQEKTDKIPFRLNILNEMTMGGVEKGTLNVLLAGVNVGKSLGLCSLAADYLIDGKNVLYISMEMSEHVCAKRIDANLLDVNLADIDNQSLSYPEFKQKMERYKKELKGKLIIKQYGNGTANANTFRALINELKLKKGFKPDVIIVDYLGICASSRLRVYSENSYTLVKAIAEEIRALAVDCNVPVWTAAQTTRGAWDSSEINMSDVAESAGLPATADFLLAVVETEELVQTGQQLLKQIKSRYADKSIMNKTLIGVKKGNQRWYELDRDKNKNEVPKPQETKRDKLDALADEFNF